MRNDYTMNRFPLIIAVLFMLGPFLTQGQGHLLYISKKSGNFDIYLNDLKGREQQLTVNEGWDWSPRWNPALNAIIYNSYVGEDFRIRSMDYEGRELELQANGLEEFNLSPDGKYQVLQIREGDFSKLVITNFDGKGSRDITGTGAYHGRASWSPDGTKILYISDRDGNNEIYLYDLISDKTERLTQNDTNEKYLSWAPDSRKFAFTTQYYEEGEPDRNDVFVMSLDSRLIQQITDNPYDDSEIAWSPDGSMIAFHSKREDGDQIYVMNTDGSNVTQITSGDYYHGEPGWIVIR